MCSSRDLGPRLVSAAVGLPLLLAAVWAGPPWFSILAAIAAAVGAGELAAMAGLRDRRVPVLAAGAAAAGVVALAHLVAGQEWATWLALAGLGLSAASLAWLLWGRQRGKAPPTPDTRHLTPITRLLAVACAGGYVGGLLLHAPLLMALDQGWQWVLFLLLVTFATDTSSFFVGRAIGRRKLAPSISPGKTWEGSIGGVAGAMAASIALWKLLSLGTGAASVIVMGAMLGVLGQAGDLAESRLKRIAGAKDSGRLIPGHGGILDRLDSVLWNLPVLYYVVLWSTL